MQKINLNKELFFNLEKQIFEQNLNHDSEPFDVIKERLSNRPIFSVDEFFWNASYVILASGFSQKTAKRKHLEIMDYFKNNPKKPAFDELIKIFGNINKIKAIMKMWDNKQVYRDEYYKLNNIDERVEYLSKLPHIGKITANHFARNLGENIVKYDVWIQRFGIRVLGEEKDFELVGTPLSPKIKQYCDNCFEKLEKETGYPKGYIDLILWKASQEKLI